MIALGLEMYSDTLPSKIKQHHFFVVTATSADCFKPCVTSVKDYLQVAIMTSHCPLTESDI